MRRKFGIVLVALGAFLVVLGLMVRLYAYPSLAKVPLDQDGVTRLEAKDATVFSIADLEEVTTDVNVAATTRGNVEAAEEAPGNTAVWAQTTTAAMADGTIIQQSASSYAFDRHTAESVDCCNNFVESEPGVRAPVKREGLIMKFPFNSQKKSYMVWDDSAMKAIQADYKGEDTIQGVKVYVYEQEVPRMQVGEREVPGSLVGLPKEDVVVVGQFYSNKRTFYIEPNTGAPINRVEEQYQTLAVDGEDKIKAMDATVQFTPEQIQTNVDDIKSNAKMLGIVHNVVPWVALGAGLLLAAIGLLLRRQKKDAKA